MLNHIELIAHAVRSTAREIVVGLQKNIVHHRLRQCFVLTGTGIVIGDARIRIQCADPFRARAQTDTHRSHMPRPCVRTLVDKHLRIRQDKRYLVMAMTKEGYIGDHIGRASVCRVVGAGGCPLTQSSESRDVARYCYSNHSLSYRSGDLITDESDR